MKHPGVKMTAEGGAVPYRHGGTENALDWKTVNMHGNSDYEILSEEELETLSQSINQEE
jgi:type IV secretion system protein VirD4